MHMKRNKMLDSDVLQALSCLYLSLMWITEQKEQERTVAVYPYWDRNHNDDEDTEAQNDGRRMIDRWEYVTCTRGQSRTSFLICSISCFIWLMTTLKTEMRKSYRITSGRHENYSKTLWRLLCMCVSIIAHEKPAKQLLPTWFMSLSRRNEVKIILYLCFVHTNKMLSQSLKCESKFGCEKLHEMN